MHIEAIIKYLLEDKNITDKIGNNIFLHKKPLDIKADNYICLALKPLDGGLIRSYQLELRCFGKDIVNLLNLEEDLIKSLDWIRQKSINDNNCIIYNSELINGGGTIEDTKTGVIERLLFFMLKIKN